MGRGATKAEVPQAETERSKIAGGKGGQGGGGRESIVCTERKMGRREREGGREGTAERDRRTEAGPTDRRRTGEGARQGRVLGARRPSGRTLVPSQWVLGRRLDKLGTTEGKSWEACETGLARPRAPLRFATLGSFSHYRRPRLREGASSRRGPGRWPGGHGTFVPVPPEGHRIPAGGTRFNLPPRAVTSLSPGLR